MKPNPNPTLTLTRLDAVRRGATLRAGARRVRCIVRPRALPPPPPPPPPPTTLPPPFQPPRNPEPDRSSTPHRSAARLTTPSDSGQCASRVPAAARLLQFGEGPLLTEWHPVLGRVRHWRFPAPRCGHPEPEP